MKVVLGAYEEYVETVYSPQAHGLLSMEGKAVMVGRL
jgi:hypothetical protein